MAQYYPQQQPYGAQGPAQNLQFFPSSYTSVSGHTTPSQASYAGFGAPNPAAQAYPVGGGAGYGGFGSPSAGVSGRMGDLSGLKTGWLAAFGTEGYDGEPPLLEELGVNFEHIRTKVSLLLLLRRGSIFNIVCDCSTLVFIGFKHVTNLPPSDLDSVKPFRPNRPAPNGRQRSIWSPPLHCPLWDLPPPLRQGLLRLYIRSSSFRHRRLTFNPKPHVSGTRPCRPQHRRPKQL